MQKVSEAVKNIILKDDVATTALQSRWLNLSAYAEKILPEVEEITLKTVKKGTIVAALARLGDEIESMSSMRPTVFLDDLTTRSPLCDVSYSKTSETRSKLSDLQSKIDFGENAFFAVSQSMSEITIIAPQSYLQQIINHFNVNPKAVFKDQVGITVRFSEKYLEVPNMLYSLQSALAVHHINCIEIISTYTEFSFIIDKKYTEIATQALKKFFM